MWTCAQVFKGPAKTLKKMQLATPRTLVCSRTGKSLRWGNSSGCPHPRLRLWWNNSRENLPTAAGERGCACSGGGPAASGGMGHVVQDARLYRDRHSGARVCLRVHGGWGPQPAIGHMLVDKRRALHMSVIYFRVDSSGEPYLHGCVGSLLF